jgi:hypothetical protein
MNPDPSETGDLNNVSIAVFLFSQTNLKGISNF